MKKNYTVYVINKNGKVDSKIFDSIEKACYYAKLKRTLFDKSFPNLSDVNKPWVYVEESLNSKRKNERKRDNAINEKITSDIIHRLEKTYMRQIRRTSSRRDMSIINCYEKTELINLLYKCLMEEDSDRLRESVQNMADNILNDEVFPTLCDIGYVF